VAHYFASDVHLRFDRPERDVSFRSWLNRLTPTDELIILGDLCDFWMGARATESELMQCESLQMLAAFRSQGGALAIMAGNHDRWLCPFYERRLGARIIAEPYDLMVHGLRIRLVHGHLLGARRFWKSWMESRAFFGGFGRIPEALAQRLDQVLAWRNLRELEIDEERHLRVFRAYAATCRGSVDIIVVGHVHLAHDEAQSNPRLIVLGGWQRRAGALRIDAAGASFQIVCESRETASTLSVPSAFPSPPMSAFHDH
jgi:UDP-2,3-diacylglucosamine hydrolase